MFTSVLLFYLSEIMNMSCLICLAYDFKSHQTARHNNRHFGNRLFNSTRFSWFKNHEPYLIVKLVPGVSVTCAKFAKTVIDLQNS